MKFKAFMIIAIVIAVGVFGFIGIKKSGYIISQNDKVYVSYEIEKDDSIIKDGTNQYYVVEILNEGQENLFDFLAAFEGKKVGDEYTVTYTLKEDLKVEGVVVATAGDEVTETGVITSVEKDGYDNYSGLGIQGGFTTE